MSMRAVITEDEWALSWDELWPRPGCGADVYKGWPSCCRCQSRA